MSQKTCHEPRAGKDPDASKDPDSWKDPDASKETLREWIDLMRLSRTTRTAQHVCHNTCQNRPRELKKDQQRIRRLYVSFKLNTHGTTHVSQHTCQKRPRCLKRDLHRIHRSYAPFKRNTHAKTHTSQYLCQKRPRWLKRDEESWGAGVDTPINEKNKKRFKKREKQRFSCG